jgi:two-component system, LytTR family, response regulator
MTSAGPVRVFVVDDEAPARRKILRFLSHDADVELAGEAGNGRDGVSGVEATKPDLLFLDVQMPGMDGLEVARALEKSHLPRIVFVTAHDEYALQAFEVHAFGYLLKPFDEERFTKVLEDAKRQIAREKQGALGEKLQQLLAELQRPASATAPRLLVEENGRGFFLPLQQIDWAEAARNYLTLHVGRQTYTVRGTIEGLEAKLDRSQFLRLNRSAVVRIDFVRELQSWSHGEYRVMLQSGEMLTWTRRYLHQHPELLQKL